MTAPPADYTWDLAWDGDSGVKPTSSGNFLVSPDPPFGTMVGNVLNCPDGTQINLMSAATVNRMAWFDAKMLTEADPGFGSGSATVSILISDGARVGYWFISPTRMAVLSLPGLSVVDIATGQDYSSDFHEFMFTLEPGTNLIEARVDGALVDSRPAYTIVQPAAFFQQVAAFDLRGIAYAYDYTAPEEPTEPLPTALSEIHLGAAGLTVDFDDVAHYPNQLTAGQVANHNVLGRGL